MRCHYVNLNKLVVEFYTNLSLYRYILYYLKEDPLVTTFLSGEVPIGILLDYLEEHPESIDKDVEYGAKPTSEEFTQLVPKLREHIKDLTKLYLFGNGRYKHEIDC
jgi:hypothetical protein